MFLYFFRSCQRKVNSDQNNTQEFERTQSKQLFRHIMYSFLIVQKNYCSTQCRDHTEMSTSIKIERNHLVIKVNCFSVLFSLLLQLTTDDLDYFTWLEIVLNFMNILFGSD